MQFCHRVTAFAATETSGDERKLGKWGSMPQCWPRENPLQHLRIGIV